MLMIDNCGTVHWIKTLIKIHKYNELTNILIQAMALTIKLKDAMN